MVCDLPLTNRIIPHISRLYKSNILTADLKAAVYINDNVGIASGIIP